MFCLATGFPTLWYCVPCLLTQKQLLFCKESPKLSLVCLNFISLVTSRDGLHVEEPQTAFPMFFTWIPHISASVHYGSILTIQLGNGLHPVLLRHSDHHGSILRHAGLVNNSSYFCPSTAAIITNVELHWSLFDPDLSRYPTYHCVPVDFKPSDAFLHQWVLSWDSQHAVLV